MSGQGSPDPGEVDPAWSGVRVAVVSASWHTLVHSGTAFSRNLSRRVSTGIWNFMSGLKNIS